MLPGATSAGLASAFRERGETFRKPHDGWQKVFFWSIVVIVVVTGTGLAQGMSTSTHTFSEVGQMWLIRLPIVGALVWLALHASRESALAKRLEEDYGYKAAIAASFEGFRKQMAESNEGADSQSPSGHLSARTLETIFTPPGRIYEKHKLTVTPATELARAAKHAAEAVAPFRSTM